MEAEWTLSSTKDLLVCIDIPKPRSLHLRWYHSVMNVSLRGVIVGGRELAFGTQARKVSNGQGILCRSQKIFD